ncbi:uncharacterized protein EDB91DRAFT_1121801 [Suillus paluster]|uniref:uncharacterized protein n=1 Tax=Suillus paluster TaxID=48578 RepID=UPI001B86157C|nr:uncharacterized protein EDB91DRAFT_1121801 [Suillus paluster]KAG1744956.1 hypothetical protein EDB91DRAFT_1121801 [Suillus paluster]
MASKMPPLVANNTMPRALLVSEIFSNIISYVGTPQITGIPLRRSDSTILSRRTLFALALTCRAFSEQALDALWETIVRIVPLLQCAAIILPPKTLSQDDEDFCVIPTESQLAIINRYAHRVRFLTMPYDQLPGHVEYFLQTFVCSSKVLLPNLRGLEHLTLITYYYKKCGGYEGDEEHVLPAFGMVIRSLPSSCPLLESFKVYVENWNCNARDVLCDAFARPLSHAIQNLQKLHTVVTPAITKDALTHLGDLSSLTSLQTPLPTGSDLEDILGSSHGPFLFKNLESVDWVITEWQDIEVLTRLWPRKLPTLSLQSNAIKFDAGALQVLFAALHTREVFRYLQRIHLSDFQSRSPHTEDITIETIRPLFYLSHLQVVDFNMASSIDIDNDDLEEMAQGWPCLEVLLLNEKRGCNAPNPVTLLGFVNFVDLCPRLKKLCIGITLIDMDEDFDLDMKSLLNLEPRRDSDTLEYLKLTCPHDEKNIICDWGSRVGMLIAKLFPRVGPFGERDREGEDRHEYYLV